MTIKSLNYYPTFSNKIKDNRIDCLSKLTCSLFVLTELTSCATLTLAMKVSVLPVFYHLSFAAALIYPPTLILAIAIITTVSALLILKSQSGSNVPKKAEASQDAKALLVDENNNQVTEGEGSVQLAKELEEIPWSNSWNEDRRYNNDILLNQKSLKDSDKGWVEHISDVLKKDGFSDKRIEQVIKSIEIQIFVPFLTTIKQSIGSMGNSSIIYLTDPEEKKEARTMITTTEKKCLIQQKTSLKLYQEINGSIGPETPESYLGNLFLKIKMTIPKDPTEEETAVYDWKIA